MNVSFECKRCGEVVEKDVASKHDFTPQFCDKCLGYFFGNEPKAEQSSLPRHLIPDSEGFVYDG